MSARVRGCLPGPLETGQNTPRLTKVFAPVGGFPGVFAGAGTAQRMSEATTCPPAIPPSAQRSPPKGPETHRRHARPVRPDHPARPLLAHLGPNPKMRDRLPVDACASPAAHGGCSQFFPGASFSAALSGIASAGSASDGCSRARAPSAGATVHSRAGPCTRMAEIRRPRDACTGHGARLRSGAGKSCNRRKHR